MNAALFRLFNDSIKNPLFDTILPLFSDKDYVIIPGILVIILVLYFGRRRARTSMVALMLGVLCADIGSEKLLKNIVREERPYAALEGVHVHRSGEWKEYRPEWYDFDQRKTYALPSSHAANVAVVAVVLALLNRRTLWVTAPVALLTGLSRVYTGNHYPGDVFGGYVWGGLWGLAMALLCPWAARRIWGAEPEPRPRLPMAEDRRIFLWILGLWTFVNFAFIYLSHFDLVADEAQYWDWSRRLALGYYSKPPMIAYIIAILTSAGGHKEWAIRSGAVLLSSGTLALIYALTLRITKSERSALVASIVTLAMPSTWAGSVMMTIDPPLAFFWALAMYAFYCAVSGDRAMWLLTGLAMGLGMLSKYTMLLLGLAFVIYLVTIDREKLRTFGPYLAFIIMILCMGGVIYWNAANDWVSIRHTASIGAAADRSFPKAIGHFFEYLGAQAALVSPILFGLFVWGMVILARDFIKSRDAAYLFLCCMVLFGFYALVSFTRRPQANWPVCAYIAAAPGLLWAWNQRPRGPRMQKLLKWGIVLGCVMGAILRSTDLVYLAAMPFTGPEDRPDRIHLLGLSIDPDDDRTNKLVGGRELGAALSKHVGKGPGVDPFIFSDRYQLTAWAAFYTKGKPHTYCMNPGTRRYNQYDLWGGMDKLGGRDGLFVTGGDETKAKFFIAGMVHEGAFERGEYLETVEVWRGRTLIKTFTISKLYNCSGLVNAPAQARY